MKRNLILAVLLPFALQAQQEEKSYPEKIDSIFKHINYSPVTSGVLYERAAAFADLLHFSDTTTFTSTFFLEGVHQFNTAAFQPIVTMPLEAYQDLVAFRAQEDTLTISSMLCHYHYLRKETFTDSHFIINTQQTILPYRNPNQAFAQNTLILPALLCKGIPTSSTFYIKMDAPIINNTQLAIEQISYYDNDLLLFTLKPGQTISWTTPAHKLSKMRYSITLTDGRRLYGIQLFEPTIIPLKASALPQSSCHPKINEIKAKIPYYDEYGTGNAWIFYHSISSNNPNCERKIKKPIIILDGIENLQEVDDIYIRTGKKIYEQNLTYINPNNPLDTIQIGDSLRLMGYDIIIYDPIMYTSPNTGKMIDGGDDYMQRNAFALIKLIQDVKDSLVANGSTEEIVIVGPSMGGQISKYALLYMEDKFQTTGDPKWNPRCRIWLSFDSPNLGANIPISVQQYVTFWGMKVGNGKAKAQFLNYLTSNASQQLMIHSISRYKSLFGILWLNKDVNNFYFNNSNPLRQDWLNTIASLGGYPSSTRNLAIANGSTQPGFYQVPGSKMFDFDIIHHILIGWLSGNSNNYFLHNYNNVGLTFTGFLDLYLGGIHFPLFNSFSSMYLNNSIYGSLDGYPGSFFDVQSSVYQDWTSFWASLSFSNKTYNSTFMSSVSALGFKNPNFDWVNSIGSGNLVCQDKIHFDNYFADNYNQNHVTFTEKSWRWMKDELLYGTQGCPNICSEKIKRQDGVNPLNHLCPNTEYTFTLDELIPSGATPQWTASTGITFVSGTTGNSVVVKYTGTVPIIENGFLEVVITPKMGTTQCGAKKIIRQKINYGNEFDAVIEFTDITDSYFSVTVPPTAPNLQYKWKEDGQPDYGPLTSENTKSFLKNTSSTNKYFSVQVYNYDCSTAPLYSDTKAYAKVITIPGGGPSVLTPKPIDMISSISVIPNPTSNDWTIFIPDTWNNNDMIHYKITTVDGKELFNNSVAYQSSISIDGSNLSRGVYVLKISNGSKIESVKLVKQ